MERKVTDEEIIEALENRVYGETLSDISKNLGFTHSSALSNRMKRLGDKIPDYAGEIIKNYAISAAKNLIRQSDGGDTTASVKLLEMAGVYIPASRHKLEGDNKRPLILEIIDNSSGFEDKKEEKNETT